MLRVALERCRIRAKSTKLIFLAVQWRWFSILLQPDTMARWGRRLCKVRPAPNSDTCSCIWCTKSILISRSPKRNMRMPWLNAWNWSSAGSLESSCVLTLLQVPVLCLEGLAAGNQRTAQLAAGAARFVLDHRNAGGAYSSRLHRVGFDHSPVP